MFIGHFALALAAKRATPRTSLGVLFAAAQLPDLLWPIFLLAGIERVRVTPSGNPFTHLWFVSYPWTHSLLMVAIWGIVAAAIYLLWRHDNRGAAMILLLALSHWGLDWVTHRPDLPLVPEGGLYTGLGLWNSTAATVLVEGLLFIGGLQFYLAASRPRDRTGRWAFWSLMAVLVIIYVIGLVGPPPPSSKAVAWSALALWLTPFWAGWADRHRVSSQLPTEES